MKRRISVFLLAACLLLSTLIACAPATPPIDDTPVPTPDKTEPDIDTPIDSSVPEQNAGAEGKIESEQNEQKLHFSVLQAVFFDTIDELIAFNKNPSLLNTGNPDQTAWLLAEHEAGTILSKDYIYVPEIADVSDYIVNGDYFLVSIAQTPVEISFVYQLKSAATELDQVKSEIRIYLWWYPNDCKSTEVIEHQFGSKQDEDGYIFCPDEHRLFRQLEEKCYLHVFAPNYPAVFDFLARFTNVQKVNVNPNAVTE